VTVARGHFDAQPGGPDGVRRLVESAAAGAPAEAVADAELVAIELVTNAWLHAHGGADVQAGVADGAIRVEVTDTGHRLPSVQPVSAESTFGRGLRLVAGLSRSWGVRADGALKTVWAEVPFDRSEVSQMLPDVDEGALLAAWGDKPDPPQLSEWEEPVVVRIAGVSMPHMLRARRQIGDLTREMQLLLAGEQAGGRPLPPALAEAARTLQFDWGDQVQRLRQQVAAAVDRGEPEIDVELRYPASMAEAFERWSQALEVGNALSRAGRLLTPPPPPQDVAFRRWWLGSIVAQLRAARRGDPAPPSRRFAEALADEYDEVTARAAAWDRLQLLQKVTGDLTEAKTVADVARIVVDNAHEHLGSTSARVYVLDEDRMLRSVAWARDGDQQRPDPYDLVSLDSDLPGAVVARTRTPLVLRDLEEIYGTFPTMSGFYPDRRALLVHPVAVGEHLIGLLGMAFPERSFDESEHVAFAQALADALAQALDRAQALAASDVQAQRMRLLADASLALNASFDLQETVNALTRLLVPRMADWAVVQVLRGGRLQTASVHHPDRGKLAWARSLEGRWPVDMDAGRGGPAVLRSGQSEIYRQLTAELVEAGAVDAEHLAALRALGMRSAVVIPLTGRSGPVGVVTLIYAESQRRYRDDELPMLEDIARRAAFAIETAQTFREQSGRLADVVRVADAAQRAILADVPPRVGPFLLAAAYRSSAAEATIGGDLFDVLPWRDGVRLLIGDVRGKGLGAIRLASLVLGAVRAAAEDLDDPAEVIATVDRRIRRHLTDEDFVTACLVELTARGEYCVALAGHPAPFVIRADGHIAQLDAPSSPPLGLGAMPETAAGALGLGDRLLLFTDGLTESRDSSRAFIPVERIVAHMAGGTLHDAVAATLRQLEIEAAGLTDDLALLAIERTVPAPSLRRSPHSLSPTRWESRPPAPAAESMQGRSRRSSDHERL
jgi:serine phosphatase RsbU (regulator of sigma subunit)